MVERKQITIIYQYNDNWIGGTYYIQNIIRALNLLNDELKPEISVLYSEKAHIKDLKEFKYPYISFKQANLHLSFVQKVINKFYYYFNGYRPCKIKLSENIVSNVYPLTAEMSNKGILNGYYWIADFQDYHLPHFFSYLERRSRRSSHKELVKKNGQVVFSSFTALNDFNEFYPLNNNNKHVLNFTSFIDDSYKELSVEKLLNKFDIKKPYFIVSNQFWRHKNHFLVLKALLALKEHISKFEIVFTGKEYDYRNPDYITSIKDFITTNGLADSVKFLGFIERKEQLQLMANSIAIIQPSLFEGWSTVVEDAKVIGKYILVSDIPLHREQIKINCNFFDPLNHEDLANKMKMVIDNPAVVETVNYNILQEQFAKDFINLFE